MFHGLWIETEAWPPAEQAGQIQCGFLATLFDGTVALVRPVTPEDKGRIGEAMAKMSPQSVYHRFFRHVTKLSPHELDYLTEVDQVRHIAWGAVDPEDPSQPGLGIARLIRDDQQPSRAEGALAVIDPYHGVGLGTVLLATLCALAQLRGIETVRACVLVENYQVVSWFQRLGARPVEKDDELITLDLDLREGLPEAVRRGRFGDLFERVKAILRAQSA